MANARVTILTFPVDAAGSPDEIRLPEGCGPFRKITVSLENPMASWTIYAPLASSDSKDFGPGAEYLFEAGVPYQGGDVLGFVSADATTNLILFCER